MTKPLPEGWKEKTLGEVCEIISGTTPDTKNPNYWNGDNYWITPAELNEENILINDCRRKITDLAVKDCSLRPMPKGTVIFSSRAPIGKVAISDIDILYCNQGFKNFVCSKAIYNKFLYYFLKLNTSLLIKMGHGTTFKEISKAVISKVQIFFPPLPEQRRIAAKLDKIFADIDKAKEHTAKNLQNAKEVFLSTLRHLCKNTEKNWHRGRTDCFFVLQRGFDLPKHERTPGNYPLISSNGITDYIDKFQVKAPAVTTGRSGTIGKTHYSDMDFWPLNTTLFVKDFKGNYPKFVYYFLQTMNLEQYSSGTGVPTLNRNYVHEAIINFPPLKEQQIIAEELDKLWPKTQELEQIYSKKLADLDELKQSILQQAFSGKL